MNDIEYLGKLIEMRLETEYLLVAVASVQNGKLYLTCGENTVQYDWNVYLKDNTNTYLANIAKELEKTGS